MKNTPNNEAPMVLLESSDAARSAGVAANTIRLWAESGRLRVFATTTRGVRLFKSDDVDRVIKDREAAA